MSEIVQCPALNMPCDFPRSKEIGITCAVCAFAGAWMNQELRNQQIQQARELHAEQQARTGSNV